MSFDLSLIGRWSPEFEHHVDLDRITAYAEATNDDNPRHTSGTMAPPGYASVFSFAPIMAAARAFVSADAMTRSVHSGQDSRLVRPIVAGMTLHARGAVVGLASTRAGAEVHLKSQTRDASGDVVHESYCTLLLRGVTGAPEAGEAVPDHHMPAELRGAAPVATVASLIADDQTFRYAAASGDHTRIHLDSAYAVSLGLPGIIVHGLCTMAIVSNALVTAVCRGDSTHLRRMAVRFARPVLPGQQITTRIFAPVSPRDRAYAFTVMNPSGKAVIQDGLAEIG